MATMTRDIRTDRPTRIVPLTPPGHAGVLVGFVDEQPVEATRLDDEDSSSGFLLVDSQNSTYAVFETALDAGLWRIAVAEPE
jgi:hypothetical protein